MSDAASDGFVYVDGRLRRAAQARVSALDRGFTLGDGLFETMRARGERVLLLDRHLARLRDGASVLEIPLPPEDALRAAIRRTLRAAIRRALRANAPAEAVVRLTVTRGLDTGRGLDIGTGLTPTVVVRVTPFVPPAAEAGEGISGVISGIRRNESSPLSRIKSCNYGDSVLARREARARGAADALLLNMAGHVACATSSNVFVLSGGVLYTPPVESGVLPGVTRQVMLDLAASDGIPVRVEPVALSMLHEAGEAFLTNTVQGVTSLTRLDGRAIGDASPGPITRHLAQAYKRFVEQHVAV